MRNCCAMLEIMNVHVSSLLEECVLRTTATAAAPRRGPLDSAYFISTAAVLTDFRVPYFIAVDVRHQFTYRCTTSQNLEISTCCRR
mmetsp:Transcript_14665/g.31624  ORF Transcript_14665/g.31624 Transcript_14665/m.31624 type:complete len:86 (+) Transcript_14665:1100-1357(+)